MYCLIMVAATLVFTGFLIFPHTELAVLVGSIDLWSMWKVAGGE